MSVWRRRALGLFPELRPWLRRSFSLAELMIQHVALEFRQALGSGEVGRARELYEFAEWCLAQPAATISEPAQLWFFRRLFQTPTDRRRVAEWVSPRVVSQCGLLWEQQLDGEELAEVRKLLLARKDEWHQA